MFQLGSTLLEACVLAVLRREDSYGYMLTQSIKELVDISESTLYPVLRRLQKDGLLTAYDEQYSGRNRRFYRITPRGSEQYEAYVGAWQNYKVKLDLILLGGIANEQV